MMGDAISHAILVERAVKWLQGTKRCLIIAAEIITIGHETPDVIGFTSFASYLVECKSSRTDFLADSKKLFRITPHYGMGDYRYYLCAPNVILVDDLPEKWGLLWAHKGRISIMREVDSFKNPQKSNPYIKGERQVLYSLMRRAIIKGHAPKIWRGGA